jgi:S-adenosylmethionine:tRNA ribosyltransferase-isomerase
MTKTSDFDYTLPSEMIAQNPIEPRDASRLLVLDRKKGQILHRHFNQIGEFLQAGDLLVLNETRVIPARIYARKIPTGGKVELLLLRRIDGNHWETIVGGKRLNVGKRIELEAGIEAEILQELSGARRVIRFQEPIEESISRFGHMPLPPYIHKKLEDPERYQTIFARKSGSAAAPTAGLHFTSRLFAELEQKGVQFANVTLHIGLDTFAPVTEEEIEDHQIHTEWCQISTDTAEQVNQVRQRGGRVIAVGTTSVRSLESAARKAEGDQAVGAFEGTTDLFIMPGYKFRVIDGMITNFHLPRSTLLMLVSAFVGRERLLKAYEMAKKEKYRFYSFGDAMLIM